MIITSLRTKITSYIPYCHIGMSVALSRTGIQTELMDKKEWKQLIVLNGVLKGRLM